MTDLFRKLWSQEEAQDIAEYAVMLAVVPVIVVGTIRLIGSHANQVFSSLASSIGQKLMCYSRNQLQELSHFNDKCSLHKAAA
jgi:Flp pilus assembly pilin Flp